VAEEIDALVTALGSGDVSGLEQVANRWTDGGRMLDAARVGAAVGAVHLHRGDQATAKDVLHASKQALTSCGASGDADMVAALLRQTGARSRAKSRTTNVGPLTKRELEIARLVASGLKNAEVASTLFLAEKTVAAHLSNIYGKVEVRSRVQLTAWIRENDPEFGTALAG
jgi:DNA-binding NarL/FixJ family response regulator